MDAIDRRHQLSAEYVLTHASCFIEGDEDLPRLEALRLAQQGVMHAAGDVSRARSLVKQWRTVVKAEARVLRREVDVLGVQLRVAKLGSRKAPFHRLTGLSPSGLPRMSAGEQVNEVRHALAILNGVSPPVGVRGALLRVQAHCDALAERLKGWANAEAALGQQLLRRRKAKLEWRRARNALLRIRPPEWSFALDGFGYVPSRHSHARHLLEQARWIGLEIQPYSWRREPVPEADPLPGSQPRPGLDLD